MDALEQLRRNHSQAPGLVRLSRYLSYLDAAAAALLALDRFVLKLAYVVHAAVHAESNPTGTLSSMVYMA